jgi:hypothetical protein
MGDSREMGAPIFRPDGEARQMKFGAALGAVVVDEARRSAPAP